MRQWALFVLRKVYRKTKSKVVLLIDETDLLFSYKAIVVAIPFRMRAIPIYWKIYTNEQIQNMMYRSKNTLVWDFLDNLTKVQKQALGKRRHLIWIFDRGFADVKLMIRLKKANIHFIIRVKQNVGVEVLGYVGTLKNFRKTGYFENIVYHKEERIKVNLFCAWDETEDEPMLLVSNQPAALLLLYRQRMKIEEGFRDLKTLKIQEIETEGRFPRKNRSALASLCHGYGIIIPTL
jgi:transposase